VAYSKTSIVYKQEAGIALHCTQDKRKKKTMENMNKRRHNETITTENLFTNN